MHSDAASPFAVHTCFVLRALSYKTWQTRLTDKRHQPFPHIFTDPSPGAASKFSEKMTSP